MVRARKKPKKRKTAKKSKNGFDRAKTWIDGISDALRSSALDAAELAETDPDAFKLKCRQIAEELGVGVREVQKVIRKNPDLAGRVVGNGLIKLAARALLKDLRA